MKNKNKVRDIGYDAKSPERTCQDPKCSWHGTLPIRGKILEGRVVSTKMQSTIVVERDYMNYVPKFERYERRHSRISVHRPPCIDVKGGDKVKIGECRPLSKTKHFVIIENMGS